ncbi:MAG TPA: acetoacetate--CoA ligase [Anaerolineae bacterium]|nr:acetoacetate--CoA ligase [Anaerolineae bacterium]
MPTIEEGDLIWQPSPERIANSNLTDYMRWLTENRGLHFDDYPSLWEWSIENVNDFWGTIWEYGQIKASQPGKTPLANDHMPGAEWFPGARLNYTENFFARQTDERPAMLYKDESGPLVAVSWAELAHKTAVFAHTLRQLGVQKGDRVVGYIPNIPEAIVALFAAASIGAIWSSCSPDFGSRSVLDRFQQIEPTVLVAVDGYQYNGKTFNRQEIVAELQAGLPTLKHTILIPHMTDGPSLPNSTLWPEILAQTTETPELIFEQLPFDHPLWVLYSSGTTGLPKPIVHSQGGILLEHIKTLTLHMDFKPGDRFFWYTSTGWMMWNFLIGGLLTGCTIILYNGAPGYPDLNVLWDLAAETKMSYFGTGAAFIHACLKEGITPNQNHDLNHIQAVGSTGSPLSVAGFQWVYENVNEHLALESFSGGTDLCTGFVGGCRLLPIYAGELQGPTLGAAVRAFNDEGEAVIDEVGELVITRPMPSMPIYFWNDTDNERYTGSYFEMFPGVWRHGDWIQINERNGCVIYGRSDSTINRQGIRMGTSEIYQAVESLPEIVDSLIVDLELLGRDSYMPLFLVLRDGHSLTDDLKKRLIAKIRSDISPRHVPNDIFILDEIPYTLSGKKMEVPIRRILLGQPVEKAANPGAMRNPHTLQYFVDLAKELND